jgi:hypothetical protein
MAAHHHGGHQLNQNRHALLLLGSPKPTGSTSASLGTYLLDKLATQGFSCQTMLARKSITKPDRKAALLSAVDRADPLVLAFPLYVDCLPAPLIRALEITATHRTPGSHSPGQRLIAIVNCGFPESLHNDTAIAICRRFAHQAGFEWSGGLSLGGGGAIDGKSLKTVKGLGRNVIKALNLTAEAICQGKNVPPRATALMTRPLVPAWLYIWLAERGFKRRAKACGVIRQLEQRPYQA